MLDDKKKDLDFFKSVDTLQSHQNQNLVDQINADEFVPQSFKSTKQPDNILIDLKSQTISVPKVAEAEEIDALIHPNFLGQDDEQRMKKWVKKMYLYRQRLAEAE
jgi:arginine/serine-rich coiled-coil protein 1